MFKVHTLHDDGHKSVAVALNASDTPGHPVTLLHGIGSSVRFWGSDQIPAFTLAGISTGDFTTLAIVASMMSFSTLSRRQQEPTR